MKQKEESLFASHDPSIKRYHTTSNHRVLNTITNKMYGFYNQYNNNISIEDDNMRQPLMNAFPKLKFFKEQYYEKINENPTTNVPKYTIPHDIFNDHPITAAIRDISEALNIIENTRLTSYEHGNFETLFLKTKPNRPILDINSGRLIKTGLATIVLSPNLDPEDATRCRNVEATFRRTSQAMQDEISQLDFTQQDYIAYCNDPLNLEDEDKPVQPQDIYNQYDPQGKPTDEQKASMKAQLMNAVLPITSRQTLQNYMFNLFWQHGHGTKWVEQNGVKIEMKYPKDRDVEDQYSVENWEDLLINLTDVVYYIPDDDLYKCTQYLKDGTVMTGTLHVPKYLDTNQHIIQYNGNMEGIIRILPRTPDILNKAKEAGIIQFDDADIFMYTNGNRDVYHHPLRFPFLSKHDDYIIPQSTQKLYPYILKIHVHSRIDTGATYYCRYTITKETYNVNYLEDFFVNKEHIYGFEKVDEFIQLKKDIDYTWRTTKRNKVGDTAVFYNVPTQAKSDEVLIKYSDMDKPKDDNNGSELGDKFINNDHLDEIEEKAHLEEDTAAQTYTLYRRRDGRMFKFYEQLRTNANFLREIETIDISRELINKVEVKMHNMEKVDKQSFKDLITYINKEDPKLSINDVVIPLIAKTIMKVYNAETQLTLMERLKKVEWINSFKKQEVKLKNTSLWEAIKARRASTYISIALRNMLHINPAISDEITGISQDF